MGTNVSNQVVDNTTEIVQDVITSVVSRVENQATTSAYVKQNVTLDLHGAKLTNCPTKVTQNAQVTALALGDFNNDLSAQITNELSAKLAEEIQQTLDQLNSGINFGQTNVANVVAESKAYIEQHLQSYVEQTIKNTVQTQGSTDQNAIINLAGVVCKNSPIGVDQDALIEVMSQNLSQTVVDNVIDNTTAADVAKKVEQEVTQTNEGLELGIGLIILALVILGVVFFVFKGFFSSTAGKILMAVLVLVLLAGLGYLIYKWTQPDSKKVGLD